jgi:hypothetical protein
MAIGFDREFDQVDPHDLKALKDYALRRVRAGTWSSDIADVIGTQLRTFHGREAADAVFARIKDELKKSQII